MMEDALPGLQVLVGDLIQEHDPLSKVGGGAAISDLSRTNCLLRKLGLRVCRETSPLATAT